MAEADHLGELLQRGLTVARLPAARSVLRAMDEDRGEKPLPAALVLGVVDPPRETFCLGHPPISHVEPAALGFEVAQVVEVLRKALPHSPAAALGDRNRLLEELSGLGEQGVGTPVVERLLGQVAEARGKGVARLGRPMRIPFQRWRAQCATKEPSAAHRFATRTPSRRRRYVSARSYQHMAAAGLGSSSA
jgi:hypothetical protein